MKRRKFLVGTAATAALAGCSAKLPAGGAAGAGAQLDPLLEPWVGPFGGVPPFDRVEPAALKPALLEGMERARAEFDLIAGALSAPSFDNTVVAYEDSGRALQRAQNFFSIYAANLNDEAVQAIEAEMSPILAGFNDDLVHDPKMFKRMKAVYDQRLASGLTAEQQRLTENYYEVLRRRGAGLGNAQKAELKSINQRLATLFTQFSQNLLADEANKLVIDDEADLVGLPGPIRDGATQMANQLSLAGKWVFTNTRSSVEPFMSYSARRDLREKAWRMWTNRGDNGDANDNNAIISEILQLRAERAKLLGQPTHAHWILEKNMAGTPDAAMGLMLKVWSAAVQRVREEVADMQSIADAEGAGITIEPWDYRYYAEKVRLAKHNIDQNEVKQYLQLDKIRDGMFWAAGEVYGLEFTELEGIPVFHSDVTVYEVSRDGQRVGLWYFDPYARSGKRSGAWMTDYRAQERFKEEITPIVSNNSNFVKAEAGQPVLISWSDATTMFHEFGHALHGLLSNVSYPSLSGTNVKRDFVEFPSQVNEYWFETREVLSRFAVHYKTGEPIPETLVSKVLAAGNFNEGFATVEYLAGALYDMKIHLAATADETIDPGEFERATMQEIGCPAEIVMRHRPTQFGHIFSSDGYSAGYYVYIWADAMTADVYEGFMERGGLYDPDACRLLEESIMRVGNSIPPDEAFRRFRGRDVDTDALMRDRGFPVA